MDDMFTGYYYEFSRKERMKSKKWILFEKMKPKKQEKKRVLIHGNLLQFLDDKEIHEFKISKIILILNQFKDYQLYLGFPFVTSFFHKTIPLQKEDLLYAYRNTIPIDQLKKHHQVANSFPLNKKQAVTVYSKLTSKGNNLIQLLKKHQLDSSWLSLLGLFTEFHFFHLDLSKDYYIYFAQEAIFLQNQPEKEFVYIPSWDHGSYLNDDDEKQTMDMLFEHYKLNLNRFRIWKEHTVNEKEQKIYFWKNEQEHSKDLFSLLSFDEEYADKSTWQGKTKLFVFSKILIKISFKNLLLISLSLLLVWYYILFSNLDVKKKDYYSSKKELLFLKNRFHQLKSMEEEIKFKKHVQLERIFPIQWLGFLEVSLKRTKFWLIEIKIKKKLVFCKIKGGKKSKIENLKTILLEKQIEMKVQKNNKSNLDQKKFTIQLSLKR
ncbi:MAG: hypothetical protein ACI86H_000588 [bacterium]|jgi:hypothetical protein